MLYVKFQLSDLQGDCCTLYPADGCYHALPLEAFYDLQEGVIQYLQSQGVEAEEHYTGSEKHMNSEVLAPSLDPSTTFCVDIDVILSPRQKRAFCEEHWEEIEVSEEVPFHADYSFRLT